jgi:hypothetical protein
MEQIVLVPYRGPILRAVAILIWNIKLCCDLNLYPKYLDLSDLGMPNKMRSLLVLEMGRISCNRYWNMMYPSVRLLIVHFQGFGKQKID